jgi:hypothetical protein
MKIVNTALIASILWLGLSSGGSDNLINFGPDAAVAAGNGGGNGNGGGKGGSNNSSENRGNSETAKADHASTGTLSSELKGLNSLKRNINGLLNSADPKMDEFRDLVTNEEEPNEESLLAAIQAAFSSIGKSPKNSEESSEETAWSAELSSWVGQQVDGLRTAFQDSSSIDSETDD